MKKVAEHDIVDFVVGNKYVNKDNKLCTCTAVTDTFAKFTYNNNSSVKYKKILFAGVYAAINYGVPFIFSNKIAPIVDSTIEHKLIGTRKRRNIYFRMNSFGETYVNIFKSHQ